MQAKTRVFLISLIGVFFVFTFLRFQEDLEELFALKIGKEADFEIQSLETYYATFKPFRDWETPGLQIEAKAASSIAISPEEEKKFLFEKNSKKILPIASLTKLMTALIVLENYDLSQAAVISKSAAALEGNLSDFEAEEGFYIKDLLYSLLMESNNTAAQALSEIISQRKFVELMNKKAQELGLSNTRFFNPTGLDSVEPADLNYSTTEDLAVLAFYLLREPLIWEILKTQEFELYQANRVFHHEIKNNNELLKIPDEIEWGVKILGGKTGRTPLAKECLLIVFEGPRNNFLINIILGSESRFEEMQSLTDWVFEAYKW